MSSEKKRKQGSAPGQGGKNKTAKALEFPVFFPLFPMASLLHPILMPRGDGCRRRSG